MKHTPGPWYMDIRVLEEEIKVMSSVNGRHLIADLTPSMIGHQSDTFTEEVKANARLIASAPELLEACIVALDHQDDRVREIIRAAIKKAKPE